MAGPDSRDLTDLPSLNALRAFDAVASEQSVSRAAEVLHVTHGAVSRQIRQLETQLGIALFERAGRGLVLTVAGHQLAVATRQHFSGLARTCRELSRADGKAPLVLSCPGSFLARWFIPRMAELQRALPELELHLTASDDSSVLKPGVDAVLRFQAPPLECGENEQLHILGPERIGPVMRPGQWPELEGASTLSPGQLAERLARLPLLHTGSRPDAWADWARHQGLAGAKLTAGQGPGHPSFEHSGFEHPGLEHLGFEHLSYLLEATLVGLGIGIAPDYLVEEDLRSGRLVAPWGFVTTEARLTLVIPGDRGAPRHPATSELVAWLSRQLAATPS